MKMQGKNTQQERKEKKDMKRREKREMGFLSFPAQTWAKPRAALFRHGRRTIVWANLYVMNKVSFVPTCLLTSINKAVSLTQVLQGDKERCTISANQYEQQLFLNFNEVPDKKKQLIST